MNRIMVTFVTKNNKKGGGIKLSKNQSAKQTMDDITNLIKSKQIIDDIYDLIKQYPDAKVPLKTAQIILKKIDDLVPKTLPLPDSDVLAGKTPYYHDAGERSREIQSFAESGAAVRDKEAAFKFAIKRLVDIANEGEINPENMSLLATILLEAMLQRSTEPLDLRIVPEIYEKYIESLRLRQQQIYDALVKADWALVCDRYRRGEGFYFQLPEYRVYFCALTTDGEIYDRFETRPVPDGSPGTVLTYDIKEARDAEEWQKEINALQKKEVSFISIVPLKTAAWNCGAYSRRIETEMYKNLKSFVDQRISEFSRKFGGTTPILILRGHLDPIEVSFARTRILPGIKILFNQHEDSQEKLLKNKAR